MYKLTKCWNHVELCQSQEAKWFRASVWDSFNSLSQHYRLRLDWFLWLFKFYHKQLHGLIIPKYFFILIMSFIYGGVTWLSKHSSILQHYHKGISFLCMNNLPSYWNKLVFFVNLQFISQKINKICVIMPLSSQLDQTTNDSKIKQRPKYHMCCGIITNYAISTIDHFCLNNFNIWR